MQGSIVDTNHVIIGTKLYNATSHLAHNKIDLRNKASLDPQLPGVLPYICCPKGVWVLHRFGVKTAIDFAHFGLNLGMVLEGIRECMNVFVISVPNE